MTIQERAFITYYASMTDAELLQVAVNKTSLIEVAQQTLANELVKRNLEIPGGSGLYAGSGRTTRIQCFPEAVRNV